MQLPENNSIIRIQSVQVLNKSFFVFNDYFLTDASYID